MSYKGEIKGFLNFSACREKDPDPYKIMMDPDLGGPKTYCSGSTTLLITYVGVST
jgi:hypothetical protein